MVALLSDCRLLVIKDIVEVIKGKRTLDESSMEILLQCNHHLPGLNPILSPAAVYLAFEHGHVGVVTVRIYLAIYTIKDSITYGAATRPRVSSYLLSTQLGMVL